MRAAVVGTFDGVHLGHLHLLNELKQHAQSQGLDPLVLTFGNHPLSLVDPCCVPEAITPVAEREKLLRASGVDVEILQFTPELRSMTAAEFLTMLRERYQVSLFMLGFNNRIGSDRISAASAELSKIEAATDVKIVIASELHDLSVSSSAIRQALAQGDTELAAEMLGRPYAIEGKVVMGRQLGRTIGFPTANVSVQSACIIPAPGVYAGRVLERNAVINIGRCPTVTCSDDAPISIEVHILNFSGNLYGQNLKVDFLKRLRSEKRFGSLDELKAAISADVAQASVL